MPSSSDATELFLVFTDRLEALGATYMVTGSVAAMIYGEPRLTHDIDVVVDLDERHIAELPRLFPDTEFYCAPHEVVLVESRRAQRGHFNIIHHESGFKADIYLSGREPLHHWGLERRRKVELGTTGIWLAPPEYVVVRKLEYHREGGSPKHRTDIQAILRSGIVDMTALLEKISALGLESEWARVQRP
jgi:hypothetical protein